LATGAAERLGRRENPQPRKRSAAVVDIAHDAFGNLPEDGSGDAIVNFQPTAFEKVAALRPASAIRGLPTKPAGAAPWSFFGYASMTRETAFFEFFYLRLKRLRAKPLKTGEFVQKTRDS
jgi:hypothetical protein